MMLLSADVSILADAGSVIAIGLTVVFLVLLLLTGVFKVFGIAMSRDEEDVPAPAKVAVPAAPAPVVAPVVGNTETVSSKPDVDGGVPVVTMDCGELNAAKIGELFYFFELSCGISAYVLGVNPFDQPGVEFYKRNMFTLLGKPGFEE